MNKSIEKVIEELGINKIGTYSEDDSYVIDIDNSDEYGKIYSILEKDDKVNQLEENTLLTIHNASVVYEYDDIYQLSLIADFDNDIYKLVVSEF